MTAVDWARTQERLAKRTSGARYIGNVDGIPGPVTWAAIVGFAATTAAHNGDAVTLRGRKLAEVNAAFQVDTAERIAGFLSNATHETGDYTKLRENLFYTSADRIRATWPTRFANATAAAPYVRNPEGLANKVYARPKEGNTQPGDGFRFRGGGDFQLTFKNNYRVAGEALGLPLAAQPELIETPAVALLAGLYYWKSSGLAKYFDLGQPKRGRAKLNTGNPDNPNPIGWADVKARHDRLMELLS